MVRAFAYINLFIFTELAKFKIKDTAFHTTKSAQNFRY